MIQRVDDRIVHMRMAGMLDEDTQVPIRKATHTSRVAIRNC